MNKLLKVNLQLFNDEAITEPATTEAVVQPVVEETVKPVSSYEDLLLKMEETAKLQMEQMRKEFNVVLQEKDRLLEEEKLKQMNEKEKEEYRKRLEYEKAIEEKKTLVEKIQALEQEKETIRNEKFVTNLKAEKPYLKNEIDRMSIKTLKEYELYLKPIESSLKELDDLRKFNLQGNKNAFNGYNQNMLRDNNPEVATRIKQAIGENFINDILIK